MSLSSKPNYEPVSTSADLVDRRRDLDLGELHQLVLQESMFKTGAL